MTTQSYEAMPVVELERKGKEVIEDLPTEHRSTITPLFDALVARAKAGEANWQDRGGGG